MCGSVGDIITAPIKLAGAVVGGLAKSLMPKPPQMPDVVATNPVADQAKLETDAAQSAQLAKLAARQRSRQNSLLSAAGAVGDTSTAPVSRSGAKATLGG